MAAAHLTTTHSEHMPHYCTRQGTIGRAPTANCGCLSPAIEGRPLHEMLRRRNALRRALGQFAEEGLLPVTPDTAGSFGRPTTRTRAGATRPGIAAETTSSIELGRFSSGDPSPANRADEAVRRLGGTAR